MMMHWFRQLSPSQPRHQVTEDAHVEEELAALCSVSEIVLTLSGFVAHAESHLSSFEFSNAAVGEPVRSFTLSEVQKGTDVF
jgi:hypothetical protein